MSTGNDERFARQDRMESVRSRVEGALQDAAREAVWGLASLAREELSVAKAALAEFEELLEEACKKD